MRSGRILILALILAGGVRADEPSRAAGTRYGIAPDLKSYPQGTAKEALASVLKAIDSGRFDYLAAQLADPVFIDTCVKERYGGRFREQVEDSRVRLDALAVRQLRRFLKDGTWSDGKTEVTVRLTDLPDRRVYLKKIGMRWYLEHRSAPPAD
jgi:hypothetical protein